MDIEQLKSGGSPLSPVIARQVLKRMQPRAVRPAAPSAPDAEGTLTAREIEILNAISRGFSYQETAGLLAISVQTVHTHLKRIYRKLRSALQDRSGVRGRQAGVALNRVALVAALSLMCASTLAHEAGEVVTIDRAELSLNREDTFTSHILGRQPVQLPDPWFPLKEELLLDLAERCHIHVFLYGQKLQKQRQVVNRDLHFFTPVPDRPCLEGRLTGPTAFRRP